MTKTFDLEYNDGWYGLSRPISNDGKYVKPKPVLCSQFVIDILGINPEIPITVVISDEQINDAVEIKVLKGGYYRWSWQFLDRKNNYFGMGSEAENILTSFFNEERDDGLNTEIRAWIRIKVGA